MINFCSTCVSTLGKERLTFDAMMSSVLPPESVPSYLSPFTLALLEDSVRLAFLVFSCNYFTAKLRTNFFIITFVYCRDGIRPILVCQKSPHLVTALAATLCSNHVFKTILSQIIRKDFFVTLQTRIITHAIRHII